ncbi:MAG: alpha-galactosidase, partial [Victivallaceae bacterium]|nr:alpha-galactosidase [Victivallaceae bacterium]
MQTELKYNNTTVVKCELDKKGNLFLSNLFNIKCCPMPMGFNSIFSIKSSSSMPIEESKLKTSKENKQNQLMFSSVASLLEIQSLWSSCNKTGIVSRKDTLVNKSKEQIKISRALASFAFAPGNYEVYSESSIWCRENQGKWRNLQHGAFILKNEGGRTTQGGTPYICLREKTSGAGVIFHIIPRGNWVIKVTTHTNGPELPYLVLEIGLSDEFLDMNIAPSTSIELPEILIQALPENGIEFAAPALHQYVLENLLQVKHKKIKSTCPCPVVYNTWFDCFHKLEITRLRSQLAVAKQVGCEVFVVDAGWYGANGGSWFNQTGDWRENLNKAFKGKMFEFSQEVRKAGLGFGLWMEPERLCKDVPIMKTHPEWFLSGDGECFYPNLTLAEVYDYTFSEMSRLIATYQLVWMKIDFNFKLGIDPSGAEFADYYTKWYHLLDELKERYPNVFFEGCTSGGMRLDLNTLSHFDTHFLSDNVNPWDVLRISQSALLRFPPGKIIRWAVLRNIGARAPVYGAEITFEDRLITPAGNGATWNEFESVNFDFAVLAAMPGGFGLSGDIASLSEKYKIKLRNYINFYKEWREFISNSSAELLTPVKPLGDRQGWIALQLTNPKHKERLLFIYRLNDVNDKINIKLRGIEEDKQYAIEMVC